MKTRLKIKIWCGMIVAGLALLTMILVSMPTSAAGNVRDTILEKAVLYGVQTCYNNGSVISNISASDYRDYTSIVSASGSIRLPAGYNDKNALNCRETFEKAFSIARQSGQTQPASLPPESVAGSTAITQFMSGLGYSISSPSNGGGGQCATYTYANQSNGTLHKITMCASSIVDGRINTDQLEISYQSSILGRPDENGATVPMMVEFEVSPNTIQLDCNTSWMTYGGCSAHTFTRGETNWNDFVGEIFGDLDEHLATWGAWQLQPVNMENNDLLNTYSFRYAGSAAQTAVGYLSNGNYSTLSLALTEPEKIVLLQGYVEDIYKAEKYGCNLDDDTAAIAQSAGYDAARIYTDGSFKTCYIKPTERSKQDGMPGYNSAGFFNGVSMDWNKIIAELNSFTATDIDSGAINGVVDRGEGHPDNEDNEEEVEANCYNATSLSWILCASIEIVGNATESVYDSIVDNYLEIGAKEMSPRDERGKEQGVYHGWTAFRDIANIIFVIMLIIVIFSQVTGLGLTNYGVKKTLPTLIMVAILVNLSFIICQIAVDATNILGDGLRGLFVTMGSKIPGESFTIGHAAAELLKTMGVVMGGAAVATGVFALTGGLSIGSMLIPVFMVLITSLFGVVFFFIVLAVRKAGVLILVTLAPIAIICYALPNTKNIFNRWYKLFTSLLIVYPICGLLMGAGDFFSKVLMTTTSGFLSTLAAVLLQVVPFFMIPSMVRGSLAMAGNIGAKISQLGNRWGTQSGWNLCEIRCGQSYADSWQCLESNEGP